MNLRGGEMHISGPLSRGWHTKFPSSWSWFNLSQAVRAIKLCFTAGGLEPCYRPLDLLWTCVGWCAALTGCRLTEATQAAGCWCEDRNRTEIIIRIDYLDAWEEHAKHVEHDLEKIKIWVGLEGWWVYSYIIDIVPASVNTALWSIRVPCNEEVKLKFDLIVPS